MDDLLDVYGDMSKFGKTVGGDIVANKKTYLLITALLKAKGADAKKLNELIEKSVGWYDVLPSADATTALAPQPVLRWRNVARKTRISSGGCLRSHQGVRAA